MHIRSLIPALLTGAVLLVGASSCKKKEEDKPKLIDSVIYPSYSHLDSGNYWVYGVYFTDTLGNTTPEGSNDSCYVAKDTTIGGHIYHKYVETTPGTEPVISFLRDSLHYLIKDKGKVLFSSQDFSTIFSRRYFLDPDHHVSNADTFAVIEQQMVDQNKTITVPAGTFRTSTMRATWTLSDSADVRIYPRVRRLDARYSPEVGKISEGLSFYANDPRIIERRLLRYRVR